MKLVKMSIGVIIILILSFIVINRALFSFFPELVVGIGFGLLPSPSKPAITYGEFPFRLVYELEGTQFIIEDTIICEYDGIGIDSGRGKHRTWKAHFLSNGIEVTYLGVVLLEDAEKAIYMSVGGADYYMGDWENMRQDAPGDRGFENTIRIKPMEGFIGSISDKDLLEKYNIKIIEWTHSPQKENKFK